MNSKVAKSIAKAVKTDNPELVVANSKKGFVKVSLHGNNPLKRLIRATKRKYRSLNSKQRAAFNLS